MADRRRFLKLEAWVRGLVDYRDNSRASRLREKFIIDYLAFERAEKFWRGQLALLSQIFGSLEKGPMKLSDAAEAFTEATYPWEAFQRMHEESLDPKYKAARDRKRVLQGTGDLIDLFEQLVDSGQLPGGPNYAEFKARRDAERKAKEKAVKAEEKKGA